MGRGGRERDEFDEADGHHEPRRFTGVDAERDEFFELCSDVGEDVADLVVG
ncbi:hypothetical protein ABZ234_01395 [Nocardiopsis sp. NPDC006198]|uniref:hypothetical protein n=1 Tax=Nocardiopsis sp. NPDC006198 TaxID=3154472 RepID=UPI0033A62192